MIKIMGWQITYIGLSDKNNKKSHLYKDMYACAFAGKIWNRATGKKRDYSLLSKQRM